MTKPKEHVVLFSTGASSALAAERVLQKRKATLLFTDTQFEDEDNYRFLDDVLRYFKSQRYYFDFIHLKEGRNPLQIFEDQGVLGCDRIPVCSRILKSEQTVTWVQTRKKPIILYFGFDYKELHRAERVTKRYAELGVQCAFPLCEKPFLSISARQYIENTWKVKAPRMYDMQFAHANCGGRCVRGKLQHWRHLLRVWPDRYKEMEEFEANFKEGKYTFLKGYSLKKLREEYEQQLPLFEEEDKAQNVPCIRCV